MNAAQAEKAAFLLDQSADPNARDHRSFIALHRAAEMGHLEVARMLLARDASPNIGAQGDTPLSLATKRNHEEMVTLMSLRTHWRLSRNIQAKWQSNHGSHYELPPGDTMSSYPKKQSRVRGWIKYRLGFLSVLLLLAGAAVAQPRGAPITPHFEDVDFTELVQAVSAATGKNFIIDPRVHARVTMISSTELSPKAFYDAFLSIVSVHGFIAVPSKGGDVITILPGT